MFGYVGGDGRTVVGDGDLHGLVGQAAGCDVNAAVGTGGANGLDGVLEQVEDNLADQVFVSIKDEVVGANVDVGGDGRGAGGGRREGEAEHALEEATDVEEGRLRRGYTG